MKKIILVVLIIVSLLAAGWFGYKKLLSRAGKFDKPMQALAEIEISGVTISGVPGPEEKVKRRPLAVMVENFYPSSRPQSGLSQAEIVYETLAEGGITRYLALFQGADVPSIGPVRSARPYFAEIANSWQALYAHVGGSPEVLEKLRTGGYTDVIDINEFYQGKFFKRIQSRDAPHNVYTSTELLYGFLGQRTEWRPLRNSQFEFKDDTPVQKDSSGLVVPAYAIDAAFSTAEYNIRYVYNHDKNVYTRFVAGKKDVDSEGKRTIEPKTVIVQLVEVTEIPNDPALRVEINLTGQGKAYVFMDGKVVAGAWKNSGKGRTIFTDEAGKEVAINRGQVWVELIPSTKASEFNWTLAHIAPNGEIQIQPPPPPQVAN